MPEPIVQRAFSAGELAPTFHARADLPAYAAGARRVRNFLVRKEGGVSNRAGFRYIATAKVGSGSNLVKIYRWAFNAANASQLIEVGDFYFRFYKQGVPITVVIASLSAWSNVTNYVPGDLVQFGGVAYYSKTANVNQQPDTNPDDWYALTTSGANAIYEIPTPYNQGSFNSPGPLVFTQSGSIITITHPAFAPMELQNLDPLGAVPKWVLVAIVTAPGIAAPGSPASVAGPAGTRTFSYKITAVRAEDFEESLPSSATTLANVAEGTPENPHQITWAAVTGAAEYHVYADKFENGTFGFIGVATGQLEFWDSGLAPDFEVTPPQARVLFNATNDYPWLSTFFQQRRWFAYSHNKPATVWGSRTGFRSNFSISSPLQDDDAITFTHASNDMNVVRHLIALKRMVMLTETGEWVIRGDQDGVMRPTAINLDQEGYSGSSPAFPTVVGSNIIYVQARGSIVRDLKFTNDVALVDTRDLTLFASHLVERLQVTRLEYMQDPHSIVWATRSDGVLLGCTYLPSEDTWAWHWHDTYHSSGATSVQDVIEDICVVPEAERDVLYAVIKRTINGSTLRYIERLERREINEATFNAEVFFVDAGKSYSGAPIATMTGLNHLIGQVVAVVADGTVIYNGDPAGASAASFTVNGSGEVALGGSYSDVHVGLPIRFAELETLDLDAAGSSIRDKRKNIIGVGVVIDKSVQGFSLGPDTLNLVAQSREPWEAVNPANERVSKRVEAGVTSAWMDSPRVFIRQTQPMPLTVLAIMPLTELGG